MTINEIIKEFNLTAEAETFGNGHINDTYIVKGNPKHTVQKINTFVFKEPEKQRFALWNPAYRKLLTCIMATQKEYNFT